jgi:hypothetical protein
MILFFSLGLFLFLSKCFVVFLLTGVFFVSLRLFFVKKSLLLRDILLITLVSGFLCLLLLLGLYAKSLSLINLQNISFYTKVFITQILFGYIIYMILCRLLSSSWKYGHAFLVLISLSIAPALVSLLLYYLFICPPSIITDLHCFHNAIFCGFIFYILSRNLGVQKNRIKLQRAIC